MKIPESTIAELNAQADLVAIIRRHTTLKPAGREFKGCCPFHGEKTPSFFVNPQTNLYYCFGCGAKGNAINFLVNFEKLTFLEAIKELAQKTGIELPKEDERPISYTRTTSPTHFKSSHPKSSHPKNSNFKNTHSKNSNTNQPSDNPTTNSPTNPPKIDSRATPATQPVNTPVFDIPYVDNINIGSHVNTQTHHAFDGEFGNNIFINDTFINNTLNNDTLNDGAFFDNTFVDNDFVNTDNPFTAEYFDSNLPPLNPFESGLSGQDGNLYQLLNALSAFYQQMLHAHPVAMQYLLKRGISQDSLQTFALGYAPMGWQHLEQAFPQDIAGLKTLGLIRTSQKGRDFDLLRDRIIFPIKDKQGRIVGFAGRALDDDTLPKYINSSDSVVFSKQHILYGYHESRVQRAKDWLVVEGYLDVISLYQAGIYGAVAPMGTAVNENQLASLLKLNDTLTLCFDGDKAGQKAALRTLEVAMPILADGKALKFLTLPDNHDPDTYIQAYGADGMRQAIAQAVSLSDYLYTVLASEFDLNQAEQKAAAMARLKEISSKLPKGSSFRWWLNSDIYNRLKNFSKTRSYTPPNLPIDNAISPSEQLLLCLLYAPMLITPNPLERIYHACGLPHIDHSFAHRTSIPTLPTWENLQADGLKELIGAVLVVLPFLQPLDFDKPQNEQDFQKIDANAQLILSALSDSTLQKTLGQQWRDFFYHIQHHPIGQLQWLFDELLCQVIIATLKHEQAQSQGLVLASLYKKRLIALENWLKHSVVPVIEKQHS